MHQSGCHQKTHEGQSSVTYTVHAESDVVWGEDGEDHRSYCNTGRFETVEEAQKCLDNMKKGSHPGIVFSILQITTTVTTTHRTVTEWEV